MNKIIKKQIKDKFVIFDKCDEGIFNKHRWWLTEKANKMFYVVTDIYIGNGKNKRIYFHQLIMGKKDNFVIDHINRNPLDNRRCNLRFATKSLNGFNSKIRIDNKTGYRNISYDKSRKRWVVRKQIGKKYKFLGRFNIKKDAVKCLESVI